MYIYGVIQWLKNEYLITECPPGYTGSDCVYKCLYPYYGDDCLMKCRCSADLCDFVSGCKHTTVTGQYYEIYFRKIVDII